MNVTECKKCLIGSKTLFRLTSISSLVPILLSQFLRIALDKNMQRSSPITNREAQTERLKHPFFWNGLPPCLIILWCPVYSGYHVRVHHLIKELKMKWREEANTSTSGSLSIWNCTYCFCFWLPNAASSRRVPVLLGTVFRHSVAYRYCSILGDM